MSNKIEMMPVAVDPLRLKIIDQLEAYVEGPGSKGLNKKVKRHVAAAMLSGMAVSAQMLTFKPGGAIVTADDLHKQIVLIGKSLGMEFEE